MFRRAFTIIELVIVIVVVLILASAAIAGAAPMMRTLRLNAAGDKLTLMIQQARSLAQNDARNTAIWQPDAPITRYGIEIRIGEQPLNTAMIFAMVGDVVARPVVPSEYILETYTLPAAENAFFVYKEANIPCNNFATIVFSVRTAKTELYCDSIAQSSSTIKIGARDARNPTKQKTFTINATAGIIQAG